MIESKELAAVLREEMDNSEERVLVKQLAQRLGYRPWTISQALNQGHFTGPLLRRLAFAFPNLKRNQTFSNIFKRIN